MSGAERKKKAPGESKHRCPFCGSGDVLPILYGLPGLEMAKDAEEGKIVIGGCIVDPEYPTSRCKKCGHEWGKLGWR
jgi:ribosomal protein S14